jgi:PAS domain S-box-containing protein
VVDKFSLLASTASDWWWEMDAQLRITFLSERYTELFGVPVASIVGKLRSELVRPDYDTPAWRTHLDDLANHRPYRDFLTTLVDAWGVTRSVKISGTPIFGPDGCFQGYIGVGHDLTELRQKENEALREARKLASVLEHIDQGVVYFDADLRVAAYNQPVLHWLYLEDVSDPIGLHHTDIMRRLAERGEFDPEDKEAAIADRLALMKAGHRLEGERARRDGRIFAYTFNPLPEGGGVLTFTDVTEARQREARLARSEEGFRYRFRNLPLPVWTYSAKTLKFLDVNDAAIAEYGYTREEFLSMSAIDMCGPEGAERLSKWLAEGGRSSAFEPNEWYNRCKDGRILQVESYGRDIDFDGEPARLTVVIDVTARKEAERLNQRLVETSQDLVFVTDGRAKLILVSPSVTRILGWSPDEMIGRNTADFIAPEDLEAARQEFKQVRRGRQTANFRSRHRHKDGRLVSLAWMGMWSDVDHRHYMVGRDMTDIDHTEAQLREAQKMEAVGRLTGGVAHDFNNILMVIMANIDELADDARLPPDLSKRIGRIANATQRASDLTRQLLAFARRQTLRPEWTDVNELVSATTGLMRRALGEAVQIESRLADGIWPVEVDRAQLQSALVNICINARDAMPEGGKLLVETGNVVFDADYVRRNPDAAAGEHVLITITDTGTGMAPEILDRVFEPFFTTKETGRGTGLGLSMVYGFVRQSRGHVKISSEVGRGTAVRIHLPRSTAERPNEAASERPAEPQGTENILLVEDDATVRASVADQLCTLGYRVTEAENGPAALGVLEAALLPFDLMLTDVVMPGGMHGDALAAAVVQRWPQIRIVFMSGYTDDASELRGRLDPDVLLLDKPFHRRDLAQILRLALDGRAGSSAA